ncbi:MAG: hypothetical protein IJM53_04485, partial [Lachnospiraceae bacterium]|nr:hypothetical protein [Lachnospiraceae bacterium]
VGGMLFGVPVMAVIGHIAEELINTRLERKGLTDMVEREEAPKTLNYSDMVKNIFKKRKKKTEEDNQDQDDNE